jgi:hypothetical protein
MDSAYRNMGADIGERDPQRRANPVDGTERHQTFAGTDVDQGHAGSELRTVQNTIRVAFNDALDHLGIIGIVRVTTMQEPSGPYVRFEVVLVHYAL